MTGTGYGHWIDGSGGAATMQFKSVWSSPTSGGQRTNTCLMEQDFYPSYYPALLPGPTPDPCSDTYPLPVALAWQHAEVITRQDYSVTNRDGDYYFEHIVDKFSAQAKIKLYTGGKAKLNRQNLWAISGSATERRQIGSTSIQNTPVWTNIPVPPGQITMGELGALGSDGIRWTTLPDDTTRTITPTANGLKWYDFDAGAQKYKMTITANGNDLSVTNPEFCVGQRVTFAPAWSPALPSSVADTVAGWTLPDKYVNESWRPYNQENGDPYYYGSVNYRVNPALLTNISTSCWYVNKPGGKVSMFENLHFTNGQYVSVAAQGNITIYRPTFTNFLNLDNSFAWDGISLSALMRWRLTLVSKYDGSMGVTQLINGSGFYYHTAGWVLDGNTAIYGDHHNGLPNPYFTNNPGGHFIELLDTPGPPPTPSQTMTATFKDYTLFQPVGIGSIFVTIATNGWFMDGSANWGSGITRSNIPPASQPVDSDEFPEWTDYRAE